MPALLINGWAGTTTITGTGPYTGIADVTSPNELKSFADLSDGITFVATIRTVDKFEIAELTKTGGATPVLTRTNILDQINGTTDPVNWGSGEKLIISGIHGPYVMTKNADNVMAAHILMRGRRIALNSDDSDYIYSPADGQLYVILAEAQALALLRGGSDETIQQVVWDHGGTTAGPIHDLFRDKGDPTANHLLAYTNYSSRDSAGTKIDYGQVYSKIVDPTNGAAFGEIGIRARAGASGLLDALLVGGSLVRAFPGIISASHGISVGKSALGIGNYGLELLSTGQIAATTNNLIPLTLNRVNNDGTLIAFLRDGSPVGSIDVASGTVSLVGAMLSHPTEWADAGPDPTDLEGTVVCSTEVALADGSNKHPLCRISTEPADPTVYGALQRRVDEDGLRYLTVGGTGAGAVRAVGPVRAGELLETSALPGAARRQAGDAIRASTLGKARESIAGDGEVRLIRATLMAG